MARQRTIKPEFFKDSSVARLGPLCAPVFQALWCTSDDGGVARADADLLKGEMFMRWPAYTVELIQCVLTELHLDGRIKIYRVGDELYAEVPNLGEHQSINRPSSFRYPRDDSSPITNPTQELGWSRLTPEVVSAHAPLIACSMSEGSVSTHAPLTISNSDSESKAEAYTEASTATAAASSACARVREKLTPDGQQALDALVKAGRIDREGAARECEMLVDGARGIRPTPGWDAVSLALEDLRTNRERVTARSLRTYTAHAVRQITHGLDAGANSGSMGDRVKKRLEERAARGEA